MHTSNYIRNTTVSYSTPFNVHSYTLSHSELLFQNAFIDTISIQCSFFIHFIFLVIDCFKVFKAGKMHCRKSNGKNRSNEKLNPTQRKNKFHRIKWKKKCRCYCYCCWLFYNIILTMDYLCKLIESNKNTCIVNRCLPLNYREISWMHLSSIWNVKCRKKSKESIEFFLPVFSTLMLLVLQIIILFLFHLEMFNCIFDVAIQSGTSMFSTVPCFSVLFSWHEEQWDQQHFSMSTWV